MFVDLFSKSILVLLFSCIRCYSWLLSIRLWEGPERLDMAGTTFIWLNPPLITPKLETPGTPDIPLFLTGFFTPLTGLFFVVICAECIEFSVLLSGPI